MKKLFVMLVLVFASAVFAEEPEIEIIPVLATSTINNTLRLSDRKELDNIIKQSSHLVSVANPLCSYNMKTGTEFLFTLRVAFLGKLKELQIKKITVDPINIGKNDIIRCISPCGFSNYNGGLTAEIFLNDSKLASLKKIEKISGVATLEKYSTIKFEIKEILSIKDKKFTNDELQKKGLELQFEDIEPDKLKIAMISKKKSPIDFLFTITTEKAIKDGACQPLAFIKTQGSGCINKMIADQWTSAEEPVVNGKLVRSIKCVINGNTLTVSKKSLPEGTTLKLEIKMPEKEFKIPFCFENIPLQTGVKQ